MTDEPCAVNIKMCGNCGHWRQFVDDSRYPASFGECAAIPVMDHYEYDKMVPLRPPAFVVFGEVGGGDMVTNYQFGCVLWREK